jgi:hypothetical protein
MHGSHRVHLLLDSGIEDNELQPWQRLIRTSQEVGMSGGDPLMSCHTPLNKVGVGVGGYNDIWLKERTCDKDLDGNLQEFKFASQRRPQIAQIN